MRALLLSVSLGAAVLSAPGAAGAAASMPAESASLSVDPLAVPWMPLLDDGRQAKLFTEAQLSSPEAIQARAASQTAYRGLGSTRARQLADRAFPQLIAQPAGGPPQLAAGQRIVSYTSDHAALVDLAGGKHAVIESALPMAKTNAAGRRVPIDLSLQSTGQGFEPETPLVDVRIPKRLSDGPSLSAARVSLTPLGIDGGASAGVLDGASAFYANTGVDSDTVVKPIVNGLQVDALLRSPRSPGRLSYRVGIPAGAHLVAIGHRKQTALVVRGASVIAAVLAPSAHDAAGTPVRVSMTASGDTLTLSLSHPAGSYDYPIYVDPTVIDKKTNTETMASNWNFTRGPESAEHKESFCLEQRYETETITGWMAIHHCVGTYAEKQYGYLSYTTKGVSKIYEFRAKIVTGGWPTVNTFMALAKGSYEAGPVNVSNVLSEEWRSVAAAGTEGNTALFETAANSSGNEEFRSEILNLEVMISQESGPSVTMNTTNEVVNGKQNALYGNRWSSGTSGAWGLGASATDSGLGISSEIWSSPSAAKWGSTRTIPCEGVQCAPFAFPSYPMTGEGLEGLPEGEDTVEASVKNPVGLGSSTGLFKVKVDNSAPHALTLTGLPASHELDDGQHALLTAGATDGTSPNPSAGIASIVLTMDGQQLGSATGGCSPGPCTKTGEWTLSGNDYAAGQHKLAIVATDNAGNVAREEFAVTFHHAPSLPLGPAGVSPTTGELGLLSPDVSIPAPGATLTVTRSYRSRHITAGAGGPLGPQWGISLGAQQSLVRLPNGNMLLTNAEGQQSVFATVGAGNFSSPPGDAALVLKEKVAGGVVTFTLSQSSAITTFALPSGGSGGSVWVPSISEGAGSTSAVTFAYKNEGGIVEPTQELAPVPAGVSCATLVKGCRALKFTYATATTATGENYSQWGDYKTRLKEVTFTAWDPTTKAMVTKVVAQYSYDLQGRLRAEWSPQVTPALKLTYGYDSEGRVTAMTSAGVQPWLFEQGTIPTDGGAGRILAVARPAATTAAEQKTEVEAPAPVNTVAPTLSSTSPVVGIKISVATNGTWSNAPLAYRYQWNDCNSAGTECTPIPGAVNQGYYPVASDEGHKLSAQVTALNANAAVAASSAATTGLVAKGTPTTPLPEPPSVGTLSVWTLDYQVPLSGTGVPQMTSTEVAKWGQTDVPAEGATVFPPDKPMGWPANSYTRATIYYLDVRDHIVNVSSPTGGISTSEYNLLNDVTRTLSPDNRATALAAGATSATVSKELDTENVYKETGTEPGTELTSSMGPKHLVKQTNGTVQQVRKSTVYKYNEGAPTEGGPYHLATTISESGSGESPVSLRTTKIGYGAQNNLGWKLRRPSTVTIDPTGLNLTHSTFYNQKTGDVTETRLPAAGAPGEEQGFHLGLQFGKLGTGNGQFKEPQSIAVTTTGNTYVLDSGNSRVEEFNPKGELITKFGTLGTEAGQLKNPAGIALDASGNVWIADTGNNRIEKFTSTGTILARAGGEGVVAPQGIAVDAAGNVWVANTGGSTLVKFIPLEGLPNVYVDIQTVGSLGTGNGQFKEPEGVAIGAEGNISVADTANNRIEQFTSAGTFIRAFSKEGTTNGLLKKPHDIRTDSAGNVWVADVGNNRIQEFGPTGTFIGTFGKEGTAEGLLKAPKGVAIDSEGNAWVADTANSRVQKWTGVWSEYGLGTPSPHDTQTIYYTAGVNAQLAACGEHPEWANLPCQTQPAANIEGALPKLVTTQYTYNYWDEPATTVNTSGTTTRTATMTYDAAGRIQTSAVTAPIGTALPTVTYKYSETLGAQEEQSTTVESVTKTITTKYNTLGQPVSYTDADGNAASQEYDVDGRTKKTNDGKGTQTFTYSTSTGLLTELVDSSAAGMKFTAT